MSFTIDGEYNSATMHGSRKMFDESCIEQVATMVDQPAFVGDDDIAVMPDGHWGSGAVIGFTMPVKDRICPNTVGVDVGCGMYAENFGQPDINLEDESVLAELDTNIRDRVPTGFDVHDDSEYHILNGFPWDECKRKLMAIDQNTEIALPEPSVYDDDYFENMCKNVGHDLVRAINSVGSLGGGNHFIELGTDSNGELWTVIHSGSRGPGAAIAQYWQDKATEHTFERRSTVEIPESEVQYFDGDAIRKQADGTFVASPGELSIDREAILADYEGEAIDGKFGQLKSFMNAGKSNSTPFDYLEGDEAAGYIVDMIFAQTYASVSRKLMAFSVQESIGSMVEQQPLVYDSIESVHNYIDFADATIRKGACRAHEGERLIVPFNMSFGTIIALGRGNPDWNKSSAHGAGRVMSRTEATNRFDDDQFAEETGDVFMSERPLDEIPSAYKDARQVESALADSVDVIDRIEPVLTVKAP